MNQEEFERLVAEREARYANSQQGARLNDYQFWQNCVPNGSSRAAAQQINISLENERAFRAQALSMAVDFHRAQGDEVDNVQKTAAKFLAFLKGGANV